MNDKLYINWINILPLTKDNYKLSNKYKNSFYYSVLTNKLVFKIIEDDTEYEFGFWDLSLDSELRLYGGISMNEVFNTIYVYLYREIYNSGTKWLLYEKQLELNTIPIYLCLVVFTLNAHNSGQTHLPYSLT